MLFFSVGLEILFGLSLCVERHLKTLVVLISCQRWCGNRENPIMTAVAMGEVCQRVKIIVTKGIFMFGKIVGHSFSVIKKRDNTRQWDNECIPTTIQARRGLTFIQIHTTVVPRVTSYAVTTEAVHFIDACPLKRKKVPLTWKEKVKGLWIQRAT